MVTTKNRNLLKAYAPTIHDVKPMNDSDSIQLFSRHAFGKDKPDPDFVNSNKIIQQCQGLPLALEIIGRSLYEKEEGYWNATLVKLQEVPEAEIVQKLRVSYESMEDEYDRELFLEISCFFVGESKLYTILILEPLFHAMVGLENLKDRCLLEFDKRGHIVMHQMVRDMGREICRKENSSNPGERRRLWHYHDSIKVLEEKTGTRNIEALILDGGEQHNIETVAFKEMKKLRMLHINFLGGLKLKGSYENFPNKIQYLHLDGWPLTSMPDDFPVKECIAIEIWYSGLTRLGLATTQVFSHLKLLNLSNNNDLNTSPEFSKFPILESLDLSECVNLKEVDESIGKLKKSLKYLNLKNCTSLRKLPSTIVMLSVLKELVISGCTNLEEFSEDMNRMKALKHFWSGRIIMNQEFSILLLGSLPGSLTVLDLWRCGLSESSFPSNFNNLPFLKELYLAENPIRFLPECIKGLTHHLKRISFYKCERLESLEGLPEVVCTLNVIGCVSLKKVTYQAGAGLKTVIQARGCGNLIWLEHKYKAIPIKSIGEHLLDTFSLEAMESTNITFYNTTSFATRKGPIQGVEEGDGILSIAFPGSHLPCYSNDWKSVTLDRNITDEGMYYGLRVAVPPCHPLSTSSNTVYGVTLCFVYSLTQGMRRGFMDLTIFDPIAVGITNTSKNLYLYFDPSWNGYNYAEESEEEELDTTWVVSNWILGPDVLETRDELGIYLCGNLVRNSHVKVKKIGCQIRKINTSQRVPTQTTSYHHSSQVGDDLYYYYGNPDMRDWN